ncbi:unnamed protein product, partial [Meganyctiphanes norvegica]
MNDTQAHTQTKTLDQEVINIFRLLMDELMKRGKRVLDGYISYRKAVLLLLVLLVLLLYLGPSFFRMMLNRTPALSLEDSASRSLSIRLDRYWLSKIENDVQIMHVPRTEEEESFLPYVGNGVLAVTIEHDSPIYIRNGRTLSLPVNFRPITIVSVDGYTLKEAQMTEFTTGLVHRLQSWEQPGLGSSIDISYQTYAHRAIPSLLMQDIRVVNPSDKDIIVEVEQMGLGDWPTATSENIKINHGEGEHEYRVISGSIEVEGRKLVPVTLVTLKVPSSLQVKAKMSTTLHVVTALNYSNPVEKRNFKNYIGQTKETAISVLKRAVTGNIKKLRGDHTKVWQSLWSSGFYISHSKAENALNGDLINATIYHVLSQVTAPLHDVTTTEQQRASILRDLAYAEGCYGGHQTLSTLENITYFCKVIWHWEHLIHVQGTDELAAIRAAKVIQWLL